MKQLTIDDIIREKDIESQPGRSAFIDECGNFGFNFADNNQADGPSHYYVVCAVIVKNSNLDRVTQQVEKVANENFNGSEMKSSSIGSNNRRRRNVLIELITLDFGLIVLIADKVKFDSDSPLTKYRDSFTKFLHKKLYNSLYTTYPKLKIVEDEYGNDEFQKGFKKYVQANRPQYNILDEYDFDYTDSRNNRLVQFADIIAGSVNKHLQDPNSPDVLSLFRSKIFDIIYFPNHMDTQNTNSSSDVFCKEVFEISCRLAESYIQLNNKSNSELVRMRVSVTKYLLFEATYINHSRYVTSMNLIKHLAEQFDLRISRNFLFRSIIAPLRDERVIIASCPHGYKIPSSIFDIDRYLSQTTGIANPMFNRLKICRDLLYKGSDGTIDIFSIPEYAAIKRYFDE